MLLVQAGFPPDSHHACHGTTERWQCSKPCGRHLWRAPPGLRFAVDDRTYLAPPLGREAAPSWVPSSSSESELEPHWVAPNRPLCPGCSGPARPAVDMFDDAGFVEDGPEFERYHAWRLGALGALPRSPKAVVLEIGCGFRVPTIRSEAEAFAGGLGASCTLVRVNPDLPLPPPWAHDATPLGPEAAARAAGALRAGGYGGGHAFGGDVEMPAGRPRALSVAAGALEVRAGRGRVGGILNHRGGPSISGSLDAASERLCVCVCAECEPPLRSLSNRA